MAYLKNKLEYWNNWNKTCFGLYKNIITISYDNEGLTDFCHKPRKCDKKSCFFPLKSHKILTKTSCFNSFTPFLCKNIRSENSVSDLVSMGLLFDLCDFDAENGVNWVKKLTMLLPFQGGNNTYFFCPRRCPELIAFGLSGRLKCVQSNSKKGDMSDMPFLSKQHALSLPVRRHIAQ